MANNNYPQITSVTSESLQAQIRTLLPSQEGFGTDLMAQNVIVPIIDLTSAAEGSSVPAFLQTALAFGSQSAFESDNASTVIANTAGFYRITGTWGIVAGNTAQSKVTFSLSDGLSSKVIYKYIKRNTTGYSDFETGDFDFNIFLASGESLTVVTDAQSICSGSSRQIADVNGTLVNPSGFNPQ